MFSIKIPRIWIAVYKEVYTNLMKKAKRFCTIAFAIGILNVRIFSWKNVTSLGKPFGIFNIKPKMISIFI